MPTISVVISTEQYLTKENIVMEKSNWGFSGLGPKTTGLRQNLKNPYVGSLSSFEMTPEVSGVLKK